MTNTEKIVEIVRHAKKPLTAHDIAISGGFANEAAVMATISQLVKQGRLARINERPYRYSVGTGAPRADSHAVKKGGNPAVEYLERRGETLHEELNKMLRRASEIRTELDALDSAIEALS